jgi:hypothetical protein
MLQSSHNWRGLRAMPLQPAEELLHCVVDIIFQRANCLVMTLCRVSAAVRAWNFIPTSCAQYHRCGSRRRFFAVCVELLLLLVRCHRVIQLIRKLGCKINSIIHDCCTAKQIFCFYWVWRNCEMFFIDKDLILV